MWSPNFGHRKLVKHYDNGEPHFLTFSCHLRLPLLSKERTQHWFTESLDQARKTHGFQLWAWVIMPEHVHLLLWPPASRLSPDPVNSIGRIAGLLADIKRPVGQRAIEYLEVHSPKFLERLTVRNRRRTYRRFWQAGSGYDENISDAAALHDIVDFIHLNPVRRGLVAKAEEWEWSSARDWAGLPNNFQLLVDRTLPTVLEIPRARFRS